MYNNAIELIRIVGIIDRGKSIVKDWTKNNKEKEKKNR